MYIRISSLELRQGDSWLSIPIDIESLISLSDILAKIDDTIIVFHNEAKN